MRKKFTATALCALLLAALFAGCGQNMKENTSSTVSRAESGVSSTVSRLESNAGSALSRAEDNVESFFGEDSDSSASSHFSSSELEDGTKDRKDEKESSLTSSKVG